MSISCTEVVCNHKLYYALDDDIVIDFSVVLCSYQVFMNIMYIISVGSEGSSSVAFFWNSSHKRFFNPSIHNVPPLSLPILVEGQYKHIHTHTLRIKIHFWIFCQFFPISITSRDVFEVPLLFLPFLPFFFVQQPGYDVPVKPAYDAPAPKPKEVIIRWLRRVVERCWFVLIWSISIDVFGTYRDYDNFNISNVLVGVNCTHNFQ